VKRTPSLRELRRDCPGNVDILPTAPARQVQQNYGRAYGQAKRSLIASQSLTFPYKPPWVREDERQLQSLELRPDVPPFDPGNPRHLRAWEAIWDFGNRTGSE
jgi:hypothetical protein